MNLATLPLLKKSVDERSRHGAAGEYQQETEQSQRQNDRAQPELLSRFHKAPEILQKGIH